MNYRKLYLTSSLVALTLLTSCVTAQNLGAFKSGTAIPDYGKIAKVESDLAIPNNTKLKVVFDTGRQADPNAINRTFNSAARFINMHVAAGVPKENLQVAIVVHGTASSDVAKHAFNRKHGKRKSNPNAGIIAELLNNNTDIYLCGQTAAYRDIKKKDLLPGVKMSLSAMTAHALLLQDGYTLNPF